MVGRDRELARVTGLLDDALAGQGRLVLCTGEAGIGKTRLAEEAAAAAAARGMPAVWARAADRGSSPPYGLWRLALDEPVIRGDGEGGSRPDLWAQVLGSTERPPLAEGADSGRASRFALFAEVRRRLAEAAEPAGLLLVFDDLQWADEASAVLLADLVRQLRGTRVLVLASYRAAPGPGDETLLWLSAEANAERVDLRGLPADAIGDLLRATGLPASAEQVDAVRSETGGNPFLVRELASMLAEQRGGEPGAVPGRVVDATAYRLAQVSQPARELLQTAAVAGNSFSAGVLARMLNVPVLSLLGPLDECRAAGFVVAGDHPGDYRFSHALVRSAVAARLSAEEQRRLHTAAVCSSARAGCDTWASRWAVASTTRPGTEPDPWRRCSTSMRASSRTRNGLPSVSACTSSTCSGDAGSPVARSRSPVASAGRPCRSTRSALASADRRSRFSSPGPGEAR